MVERGFRLRDRAWSHEMKESQQIVKRERERDTSFQLWLIISRNV